MRLLVTGARGFIGRELCRALSGRGIPWEAFEGDVNRPGDFAPHGGCTGVVHLAGKTRVGPSKAEKISLLSGNINGAANALAFAAQGGRDFFLAGTCCYQGETGRPRREGEPITYLDEYSFSKYMAEELVRGQARFFGLRAVIFRIFNVYGPGQAPGFVIPDLSRQALSGRVRALNTGAERDFIHVRDLAALICAAVSRAGPGLTILNAGSGQKVSIGQLLGLMGEVLEKPLEIEDLQRPAAIRQSWADMGLARRLLGWEPRVSLREGLGEIFRELAGTEPGAGFAQTPSAPGGLS